MQNSKSIKVFISYSHNPEEHKKRVLRLSDQLREKGVHCWIDQYEMNPEIGWHVWMKDQISKSNFVLVICTEIYLRRNEKKEKPGQGLGVCWEGLQIAAEIYESQGRNSKFIPVIFSDKDAQYVPAELKSATLFNLNDKEGFKDLFRLLTNQSKIIPTPVADTVEEMPPESYSEPENTLEKKEKELSEKIIVNQESTSSTSYINFLFRENPFFTGRKDLLEKIKENLNSSNSNESVLALGGHAGVGKTQIAIQFAHSADGLYKFILWAEAKSEAALAQEILQFFQALEIPGYESQKQEVIFSVFKNWLSSNSDWLLVLDNLETFDLFEKIVPVKFKGNVLITTQLNDTSWVKKISITPFEENDCEGITLLLRRSGTIEQNDSIEKAEDNELQAAKDIDRLFGGLPLALEQAGTFTKVTEITLNKYLSLFEAHSKELLAQKTKETSYKKSVTRAFEISLEQSRENNPISWELLQICSFLDPDFIPEKLFEKSQELFDKNWAEAFKDDLSQTKTIGDACKFSLLRRDKKQKSLQMHRLIQQVFRERLEDPKPWAEKALKLLSASFPDPEEFKNWDRCGQLLPSVQIMLRWINKWELNFPEALILCNRAGYYRMTQGAYLEAESYFRKAFAIFHTNPQNNKSDYGRTLNFLGELKVYQGSYQNAENFFKLSEKTWKKVYSTEHPDIALALNNKAVIYNYRGRYFDSEPLYKQALEMRKKLLGDEHPDVATSIGNLAGLYKSQGRYKNAEPLYKQALEMRKKILENEHPDIATSIGSLAGLYINLGRYKEAEPLYKQALEMRKKLLGEEHPDVATSIGSLAGLYSNLGRYKETEPLYKQSLEMRKKLLGDEHPDVATSIGSLAGLYSNLGRYKEAEPLYKQALELRKRLLGEEHPDVATSKENLAVLFSDLGRYKEAEQLYKQSLEMRKKLLGDEHLDVANSKANLATLFSDLGRYKEAEQLYKDALEMEKKLLGDEHPNIATSIGNLAGLYADLGRHKEAEQVHKQVLEMRKKLLGEEHPHIVNSKANLAALYTKLRRYKEAESLFKQALEMGKKLLGEEHPHVASLMGSMALLFIYQERYKEAEQLQKQALAMEKKLLGEEHPSVATSLGNFAGFYDQQGDYEKAEPLFIQSLEIKKKLLGKEHPDIQGLLCNLGNLYWSRKDFKNAQEYFQKALGLSEAIWGSQNLKTTNLRKDLKMVKKKRPISKKSKNKKRVIKLRK